MSTPKPFPPVEDPTLERRMPRSVRAYMLAHRALERAIAVGRATFNGVWLAVLDRDTLHAVDDHYYDHSTRYGQPEHDSSGLFDWEKEAIETHFQGARRLLVYGTGGGRETLALCERGFEVDALECNARLRDSANKLLEEHGHPPKVRPTERDHCPKLGHRYDGIVIGLNTYMLVQTRDARIALLKQLRSHVDAGAPLLLSFYTRKASSVGFRTTAAVANSLAVVFRRARVELGDSFYPYEVEGRGGRRVLPYFVHYFAEDELAAELHAAGFDLVASSREGCGHAVGRAGSLVHSRKAFHSP